MELQLEEGENRVDFLVLLAAGMVEREELRKKKLGRERKSLGAVGCRVGGGGRKALRIITKIPLPSRSFYFKLFNNKHR